MRIVRFNVIFMGMWLLIFTLLSMMSSNIATWGHIGGIITGFSTLLSINEPVNNHINRRDIWKTGGMAFLLIYFIFCGIILVTS
jgi:hypothetical protein